MSDTQLVVVYDLQIDIESIGGLSFIGYDVLFHAAFDEFQLALR